MPGFANLDAIIAAITVDGQQLQRTFRKESTAPETAGVLHSLWRNGPNPDAGGDGAAGSGTPGAGGTALTNAAGGLGEGWPDTSPATKHLVAWDARANIEGTLILLDRLVSVSGISLVGTGSKDVNSVALPSRATGGVGVQAFLEVTTVTNTNAPVGTISYTDQGGTPGATSPTFTFPAAATNIQTLVPIGYASGDYGIQSVETITLSTAASSTGVANLILAREIARLPLDVNVGNTRDFLSQVATLPRIHDGATLMLAWLASGTTAPQVDGCIYVAYN